MQAVEGDDWSSVIDGQTKQTLDPRVSNGGALKEEDVVERNLVTETGASEQIVSPFASGSQAGQGLYSAETYDFTMENVDKVLDEVRPYLVADGRVSYSRKFLVTTHIQRWSMCCLSVRKLRQRLLSFVQADAMLKQQALFH